MGEIVRKHARPPTDSTFLIDSEMVVYLHPGPLAELIAYQISTYGVHRAHDVIRRALADLAERKGNVTVKRPSKFCSRVNAGAPIELDYVDAVYIAFGRPDLFRIDYPELYSGELVRTNV